MDEMIGSKTESCNIIPQGDYNPAFSEVMESLTRGHYGLANERLLHLTAKDKVNYVGKTSRVEEVLGKLELTLKSDCDSNNDIQVVRDDNGQIVKVLTNAPAKDGQNTQLLRTAEIVLYDSQDAGEQATKLINSPSEKRGNFWTFGGSNLDGDSLSRKHFKAQNPQYNSAAEDKEFFERSSERREFFQKNAAPKK